jgi:hypothetical protein
MGEDLIYMRNRFYSPVLGRFMAEDPIGLAGGDVSFYRYTGNDPVDWVDPEGLMTGVLEGAGIGTITCGPVCGIVGGTIGLGVGIYTGQKIWDHFVDDSGAETSTDVTDNAKDETCDDAVPGDECEDEGECKANNPRWKDCSDMVGDYPLYVYPTRIEAESALSTEISWRWQLEVYEWGCLSGQRAYGGPYGDGNEGVHYNCFIDEDPDDLHVGSLASAPCCDKNDNEDIRWAMFPKDPPSIW